MIELFETLLHQASVHQQHQRWLEAIECLTEALQYDAHHAGVHDCLGQAYQRLQNTALAIEHYQTAIALAPSFVNAHYHLAQCLLQLQQFEAAEQHFNCVLALEPDHGTAHFYMGVLQLRAGLLNEAAQSFERVLTHQTHLAPALTNLGVIALQQDEGQLAVDYFTKALIEDANHIEARSNLAATFMHHDRFENALMHYGVLLNEHPNDIEYLYNSGVAQMMLGHLSDAKAHFNRILTQDEQHVAALQNLAAIHMRLEHRVEAIALLKRACRINPNDSATNLMLQALTGDNPQPTASVDYARHLFNNYALYYDQHLREALHYTLPQQVGRLLHQKGCLQIPRTLDLGCGTGLSGVVLRECSQQLIGVDIAAKMLEQARKKGIYDELIEAECLSFLTNEKRTYDAIVALDVLPYFGALEPLFEGIAHHLVPNGLFIVSCEISSTTPWHLQETVRFCHHRDYLHALFQTHGFECIAEEIAVARQQEGQPVSVLLFMVRNLLPAPAELNRYS